MPPFKKSCRLLFWTSYPQPTPQAGNPGIPKPYMGVSKPSDFSQSQSLPDAPVVAHWLAAPLTVRHHFGALSSRDRVGWQSAACVLTAWVVLANLSADSEAVVHVCASASRMSSNMSASAAVIRASTAQPLPLDSPPLAPGAPGTSSRGAEPGRVEWVGRVATAPIRLAPRKFYLFPFLSLLLL